MNEDMGSNERELDAMLQALGRLVRSWRVRRDLTRSELAALAGVSEKQVGKIERGERGQIHEAWRIADALEVEFSELVSAAEEEARRGTG